MSVPLMDERKGRRIGDGNVPKGQCLLRLILSMAIFSLGCGYKKPTDPHEPDDPIAQMRAAMRAGNWPESILSKP